MHVGGAARQAKSCVSNKTASHTDTRQAEMHESDVRKSGEIFLFLRSKDTAGQSGCSRFASCRCGIPRRPTLLLLLSRSNHSRYAIVVNIGTPASKDTQSQLPAIYRSSLAHGHMHTLLTPGQTITTAGVDFSTPGEDRRQRLGTRGSGMATRRNGVHCMCCKIASSLTFLSSSTSRFVPMEAFHSIHPCRADLTHQRVLTEIKSARSTD